MFILNMSDNIQFMYTSKNSGSVKKSWIITSVYS